MTRIRLRDKDIRTDSAESEAIVPRNTSRFPVLDSGRVYAQECARLPSETVHPLKDILAPLSLEAFFRGYWEKRVLHVKNRGTPDRFKHLLSIPELLRQFQLNRIPPEHTNFHIDTMTYNKILLLEDKLFDFDAVLEFLQGQAGGVVASRLGDYHPPVNRLANSLSEIFGCQTIANAYYGSKDSKLFPLHWDTHDTLILQTDGCKDWEFFGSLVALPLRRGEHSSELYELPNRAPSLKITMSAGDLLYVPRGVLHRAMAKGQDSLHLTFGLYLSSWFEVVELLANKALALYSADLGIRKACPLLLASGKNAQALDAQLALLVRDFAKAMGSADAREALAAHETGKPVFTCSDTGVDLTRLRGLRGDTRLVRYPCLHTLRAGKRAISLQFNRKRLTFPLAAGPALKAISGARSLRVDGIPGRLDLKEKMVLAARLIKEGFLYVADQAPKKNAPGPKGPGQAQS